MWRKILDGRGNPEVYVGLSGTNPEKIWIFLPGRGFDREHGDRTFEKAVIETVVYAPRSGTSPNIAYKGLAGFFLAMSFRFPKEF